MKDYSYFFKRIVIKVLVLLSRNRYIDFREQNNTEVTFVMGMFRSGTTLTSKVLERFGFNFGSKWRLLRSLRGFEELNPDGFYEDFLFAQLSRMLYRNLDKSGDNPPNINDVENFRLTKINIGEFINCSEYLYKEQRILFLWRIFAYCLLILMKERAFLSGNLNIVKIPMLTPFYAQLKKWLPNSKFIIVVRNPKSTIKSAKKLSENISIDTYNIYYQHLSSLMENPTSIVISYDNMLQNISKTIKALEKVFNSKYPDSINEIIDINLVRNSTSNTYDNTYFKKIYESAINN